MTEGSPSGLGEPRLAVLKALGDNTRYAIYLELARSPRPLATAEVAETLDLHPNTVRPHLERMRDVGLLEVETDARGAVGRPHHRYSLANDAPSLGLEPATFPVLARMLLRLAANGGLGHDEAVDVGREQGGTDAQSLARALGLDDGEGEPAVPGDAAGGDGEPPSRGDPATCVGGLMARLDALGFDPELAGDATEVTVGFAHCPFRELAESNPEIVCALHQGLVEGIVVGLGGAAVDDFHPLTDRTPCQVDLALASP
ncbi:MAG TPA: helix-turn-helix domain-containing protein [Acidimicrobiales bacterium]|nr:helix-turn-helix domain-containing protein [Acidimicrobiales bacterium]